MKRFAPLVLLAALLSTPLAAAAPAAEGPADVEGACWDVAPPWSVCVERVDGRTCAWVNWHDAIVLFQCVPPTGAVAASSAAAPCASVGWHEVCVEEDEDGNPCVSVWTGMPPSIVACAPLSAAAVGPTSG